MSELRTDIRLRHVVHTTKLESVLSRMSIGGLWTILIEVFLGCDIAVVDLTVVSSIHHTLIIILKYM